MIALYNNRTYTLFVNRVVNSTERITCVLKDERTKKDLGKRINLVWGGLGNRATVDTIPKDADWEKISEINLILGPFAYEKFYEEGKVCARYSRGKVFVEKVDNLEGYL